MRMRLLVGLVCLVVIVELGAAFAWLATIAADCNIPSRNGELVCSTAFGLIVPAVAFVTPILAYVTWYVANVRWDDQARRRD